MKLIVEKLSCLMLANKECLPTLKVKYLPIEVTIHEKKIFFSFLVYSYEMWTRVVLKTVYICTLHMSEGQDAICFCNSENTWLRHFGFWNVDKSQFVTV